MTPPYLSIRGVGKTFGLAGADSVVALREISLDVAESEFVAILGPSGCGKSTLLQIVAGLMQPTTGEVRLRDEVVGAPPEGMVYLFQQYSKSLFPWRTVERNVAFALEASGLPRTEIRTRCERYLAMVGLEGFGRRYPWQLSGGMQQRVAIARALAAEPRVLLLDEPFSAVDALTRLELQNLTLEIWAREKLTILLVTHDVDEAVFMADRVAMLSTRPTTLSSVHATELPRPRESIATRELPRFLNLRHELVATLLRRDPGAPPHA